MSLAIASWWSGKVLSLSRQKLRMGVMALVCGWLMVAVRSKTLAVVAHNPVEGHERCRGLVGGLGRNVVGFC